MNANHSEVQNTKGAAPDQENAPFNVQLPHSTKESTILAILRSGHSLNRFEAELYVDHCLHSTVSSLRDKGYNIIDEWEWVPTRFGKEAHVKRYRYAGRNEPNAEGTA